MSEDAKPDSHIQITEGVLPGVTAPTLKKITDAGFKTLNTLITQTPKSLSEKSGIGEDTAESVIEKARKLIGAGFITASQLREIRGRRVRLKTGSKNLDTLLGGGIESETTTEIIGEGAAGKTQICSCLAVRAQLPVEEGGLAGQVVWIDSEGTFIPKRIQEIAENLNLDVEKIMNGIYWAQAFTSEHQTILVNTLFRLCSEHPIKLIIIDSMMGHLRAEYVGRGNLSDRQGVLAEMLQTLLKVALSSGATVVYTNQVMDNPAQLYGDPKRATGGNVMSHAAGTRLQLRKGRQGLRVAKLIDSLSLPEGEAVFAITGKGIEDPSGGQKEESG